MIPTLSNIAFMVEKEVKLELFKKTRKQDYIYARMLYFKIARELTHKSFQEIGDYLNMNHATVMHSYKKFYIIENYEPYFYNIYLEILEFFRKKIKFEVKQVNLLNFKNPITL